jgi:hypothetical protein
MSFDYMRFIRFFWKLLTSWRQARLDAEIERQRERLNQSMWRNSLAERTQEADLASGYNQSHSNTMQ